VGASGIRPSKPRAPLSGGTLPPVNENRKISRLSVSRVQFIIAVLQYCIEGSGAGRNLFWGVALVRNLVSY